VRLCRQLALLPPRVVENETGAPVGVREELERLHLVTPESAEGRVMRRSRTTAGQRRILAALELPEPPLSSAFEVAETADRRLRASGLGAAPRPSPALTRLLPARSRLAGSSCASHLRKLVSTALRARAADPGCQYDTRERRRHDG
jgi:hypothetical protein